MRRSENYPIYGGTGGAAGTGLKSLMFSGPSTTLLGGTAGTAVPGALGIVPAVPGAFWSVGQENPIENNVVSPVPVSLGNKSRIADILAQATALLRASDQAVDFEAFEERSAILEFDAGLARAEAECMAASEQGFTDADALRATLTRRWLQGLRDLRTQHLPRIAIAHVNNACSFIEAGWATQALSLGWTECDLVAADPNMPWERPEALGAAYRVERVVSITSEMLVTANSAEETTFLPRARCPTKGVPPWVPFEDASEARDMRSIQDQ